MHKLFSTHNQMLVVEGQNIFNQFTVIGKLGTGNSTVYSVLKNGDQDELAMKEIIIKNEQNMVDLMREVNLMKQISQHKHPNIIGFHDYCILLRESEYEDLRLAYMLFEKAITSLDTLIALQNHKKEYFSPEIIKVFLQKSINVHKFLQDQKIAHCDIKPENILITNVDTLDFKICDIGSGKLIKNENTQTATICGTIPFLSPELMKNITSPKLTHNPFKSDVFSLGLCVIYLITFNKVKSIIKVKKFSQIQRSFLSEGPFKDVLNEWINYATVICQNDTFISKLLKVMLIYDHKTRPDFIKLREHMLEYEQSDLQKQSSLTDEHVSTPNTPKQFEEKQSNSVNLQESSLTQHMSQTKSNFARSTLTKTSKNSQSQSGLLKKQNDNATIFKIHQTPATTFRKPTQTNRQLPEQKMNTLTVYSNSPIQKKRIKSSSRTTNFIIEDYTNLQFFQTPMKTSQMLDSAMFRQIHRKGNSAVGLKLAPIEVLSAKSSYIQEFSPKKLATSPTLYDNQTRIVTNHEGFKKFIEYFEDNHINNPKLILYLTKDQSEIIINDLKSISSIQQISIIMVKDCHKNTLHQLIKALKSFDSLENIELILSRTIIQGNFEHLDLKSLKTLTIKLKNCEAPSLTNFLSSLISNNYQNLTLHFNRIIIGDISQIMDLILKNTELKYIDMAFFYGSLDDKQHKKLYEVLSQCSSLRTLIVQFKECKLALKQAQWVFNSKLKEVILKYEKTQIDQALTSLALGLQKLSQIETIEINLTDLHTQPQILKLLFEYIKKLHTLKELKLNLNGISLTDDSIIPFMVDKFKGNTNLEIFQFSCTQANDKTVELLFSLLNALVPLKKLFQFEVVIPRVQSVQSILDICPSKMETYSTFLDVDNLMICVLDQQLINSRIDYYDKDPLCKYCSQNDGFPIFQCLTCNSIPALITNLCFQCVRSCHFGHKIVFSQVVPRITGLYSKLKLCQCISEGCKSSKGSVCSNIFGQVTTLTYGRQIKSGSNQLACQFCAIIFDTIYKIQSHEYLTTFKCGS